ncbi:DUF6082 family protein [Nonomuraea salmonea]|uniref:DUF6082 family protein n=1 Tax=Nonomuraea salmonea TaxID=46181 RepID=UPI0031E807A0
MVLVAVSVVAGMLVLSPLALRGLAALVPGPEWTRLSEIGQAYGPATTLLTAVSLLGIAASVLMQARTARIAAEQTSRVLHMELIRWAIDDPSLTQALGEPWRKPEDDGYLRLYVFYNQFLTMWRSMYSLGQITEASLRHNMARAFGTEIARTHWEGHRGEYEIASADRRQRDFCRIVEEEWQRAGGEPMRQVIVKPATSRSRDWRLLAVGGAAVALGVLVSRRGGRV